MQKQLDLAQIARDKGLKVLSALERSKEHWVPLGHVLSAHGIRGALRIHLENPEGACIDEGSSIGFLLKTGDLVILKVISKISGNRIFVEGICDRTQALALKGAGLLIRREEMPQILDNEVYLVDLLGAVAVDAEGRVLGDIVAFTDNRAQLLVEIKTKDDKNVLLPFVRPILQEIDELKRMVVFDPPLGFF